MDQVKTAVDSETRLGVTDGRAHRGSGRSVVTEDSCGLLRDTTVLRSVAAYNVAAAAVVCGAIVFPAPSPV